MPSTIVRAGFINQPRGGICVVETNDQFKGPSIRLLFFERPDTEKKDAIQTQHMGSKLPYEAGAALLTALGSMPFDELAD